MNLKQMKTDLLDMKELNDIQNGHIDAIVAQINSLMGVEPEVVRLEDKREKKK